VEYFLKFEHVVFASSHSSTYWFIVYICQLSIRTSTDYIMHWNTFSVVFSNIFGKNQNIILTFQSGQLTEQPKTLDDLGRFDLKMFRNCPIRIEIITGSKLEVFIWRYVVYVPKSSTKFGGILICSIFRPRDMQEYYMLFRIFARDVGLYSLSVFYITWTDFHIVFLHIPGSKNRTN
jgi:hypothetical protein